MEDHKTEEDGNWFNKAIYSVFGFDTLAPMRLIHELHREAEEVKKEREAQKRAAEEAALNREQIAIATDRTHHQYVDTGTGTSPVALRAPCIATPSIYQNPAVTQPSVNVIPPTPVQPDSYSNLPLNQAVTAQPLGKEPDFHREIRTYGSGCITQLGTLLSSNSITLTARGIQNQTCLHIASTLEHPDLKASELVQFLLTKEPGLINIQNDQGSTAAHLTLIREYFNPKVCKILIEHNDTDINLFNTEKQTLLHLAIAYSPSAKDNHDTAANEIAKLIINKGANLEAKNDRGQTPLHLAIQHGKREIVQLLLDKKASSNAADQEGNKPIHYAVCCTQPEVIDALNKHSADFTATNHAGQNALHYAIMMWNADWKEKKISRFNNLKLWASREQKDIAENTVEILFKLGNAKQTLSLNIKDKYGWTPLHWACVTRDIEQDKSYMITFLKKKGANTLAINDEGNTPFMTAILLGMPIVIPNPDNPEKPIPLAKHLLPHAKDLKEKYIQMQNEEGNTALHFEIMIRSKYQSETIDYLLAKGADPFKKNRHDISPYDLLITIQQKVHDQTDAERACLQNIKTTFEKLTKDKAAISPTSVNELPTVTLPEPLQGYTLPWYMLPLAPKEEESLTERTIPSSIQQPLGSSVWSDGSAAWIDVKPPSEYNSSLDASKASLISMPESKAYSSGVLPAGPAKFFELSADSPETKEPPYIAYSPGVSKK